MKKRTSIIWEESTDDFAKRVESCGTIAGVLRSYNLAMSGNGYKVVNERIEADGLSHLIQRGLNNRLGKPGANIARPLSEVLVKNRPTSSHNLKNRLVKEGVLAYECVKCGNNGMWMGEKISLHLDHINGDRNDNQIENLRILCPNCHSQTPTHSGKDKRAKCRDCFKIITSHQQQRCQACANKLLVKRPMKFDISKSELEKLVWEKPTEQIGRDFGVSGNAVAKRCKKLGVDKPPRGYWSGSK